MDRTEQNRFVGRKYSLDVARVAVEASYQNTSKLIFFVISSALITFDGKDKGSV